MLKALALKDFRCFSAHTVHFEPGCNVLIGPNGIGKTSILEALYFLSCGKSFRSGKLFPLVKKERPYFLLECRFEQLGVQHTLKACYGEEVKKTAFNSTVYPSLAALLGKLFVSVFSPTDIDLVKGGPSTRREYLDTQLAQIDPLYIYHLARYYKGLQQRNALLKRHQESSLDAWEAQMAISAHYIIQKRKAAVELLTTLAKQMYWQLSNEKETLSLNYICEEEDVEKLQKMWKASRKKDFSLGATTLGPHKDEIVLLLEGSISKTFASEGQMRSIACALRLAEWELAHEQTGQQVLFLGDDIGISLDAYRKERLLHFLLETKKQILLSSAEPLQESSAKSDIIQLMSSCQMQ